MLIPVCGGIVTVLEGCTTYRFVEYRKEGDNLLVQKSVFEGDSYVLLRNPQGKSPIYLRRNPDDTYTALLMECTHKQCTVNPAGDAFSCPCHGSRYNAEGEVLEGPARRALHRYAVTTDTEYIYIHNKPGDLQ